MSVEVGDIWRKNGKDYRVKSISDTWEAPAAALQPVRFTHDQWNADLRRVPGNMRLKFFTTMADTMELVERNARYHLNYVCPKTCHCWAARSSRSSSSPR